ncbi:signal peptidase I [Streptomyces sp. 3MP-14]|uniref:Signal peptidase I n=1 Tax=Streptomyces mimosae TaxID=2586635 RepID=A0A5N5ZYK1_9ACTN|nr:MULTISPECIES: signal peptidase I [Streptomyces]KAB8161567.1 signal peptidase I [Streptomyces mimosae]KAB8173496.1 signal peptidase I [Streptomyces sp. 3MP-14]
MTDSDAEASSGTPEPERPERDQPSDSPKSKRRWSRSTRFWLSVLLATVVVTSLVSRFVVQPFVIPSGSMEGTLRVGDRVLVNKLAYSFGGEVRRGDIVVFDGTGSFVAEESDPGLLEGLLRTAAGAVGLARSSDSDFVKRVIGIGGDRVRCCDDEGRIEVNGEPLEEPYLYPGDKPSNVRFDIRVPEGRLWVMGDHRSDSADSREYLGSPGGGTVPEDKVIGRADWVGWPVGHWTSLRSDHG